MNHQEELEIPLIVDGMTHGTLRRWLVQSGDRVEEGQSIFELETKDATFEVESFCSGLVTTIGIEGERYEVGTKIGYVESSEEQRVQREYFSLDLTFEMREAIEECRGDLTYSQWLSESFFDFVRKRIREAGKSS